MRITTYQGVHAALLSSRLRVPPVPDAHMDQPVRWLRGSVARFSTGPAHARRRALAVASLTVEPAALRHSAGVWTRRLLRDAVIGREFNLMPIARRAPVATLTAALRMDGDTAEAVEVVARAYPPHAVVTPAADRAVAQLVRAAGTAADDACAARIGLLIQACDATAGLIGNAFLARLRHPGYPTAALLAETLRHDPPVRITHREATEPVRLSGLDVPAGTIVALDLAAANRDPLVFRDPDRFDAHRVGWDRHLTFGSGDHACPGSAYATAIAAGVLDALAGHQLETARVAYLPSPTLHFPATLMVRAR